MRRVVVKLGSSVVADSDGTLRSDVLARICDQLAAAHHEGVEVIAVTSGAIARGMRVMELPQRPTSIGALQAASAVGQGKLYRVYDELLREREVTSAQLLLTFFDMSARTHYLNVRQTLTTLLEWRVLPVINENDTTATDEISFGDNDFLAAQVAVLITADELILLTDIDGLYTADPRLYPDAHIVGEVSDFSALEELEIGHTTSPLGSGGMRSKVVAAEMATAAGIATVICNGLREEALATVLAGGRDGTRFAAREARYSSFKLWLKYAKPSRGSIAIDAGAVRALRDGSASLLPVGVVAVSGDFDAGDAVDISAQPEAGDGAGRTLAKGICNYSAVELRKVMGLKSDAVREILPRATDEAVHRDYLVLDRGAPLDPQGSARARAPALGLEPLAWAALYPVAMATAVSSVAEICRAAKLASRTLAQTDTAVKDAALEAIAAALHERLDEILAANERDMELAREGEIGAALLDRLSLDPGRVEQIAAAVRQIAALADPVGEVIDGHRLPNGLDVRKVRVPLGVVAVVYEARPNVTIDAAALCLKSGNAIVLRGSSSALHSNAALAAIASDAAVSVGLPAACVSLLAGGGRTSDGGRGEDLAELATQQQSVDLIIPRGGEGLKAALQAVATVPVIYAASGNCHVYVDASAPLDRAEAIVINAKTQRPGVCNAAETLLVHEQVAEEFVPRILAALAAAEVLVRADERTLALAAGAGAGAGEIEPAREEDWETEYLAPIIAVGVVDSLEQAIEHIGRYGSGHSEAIVTRDADAARAFQLGVDAACVYVNASTRFTDGGEFGMGAEIGNSTQKLHARGPIGLRELCTFKYLVEGDGHVRG